MLSFVNAKINIGLQIVSRRPDGYHDLQTLFYPVGLYAGKAENPVAFCDILETGWVAPSLKRQGEEYKFVSSGRKIDCPEDKNLVVKAIQKLLEYGMPPGFVPLVFLEKHLPDGAGMGGGSADASFSLKMLVKAAVAYAAISKLDWKAPDEPTLARMALSLGADCPFFLYNKPAYAEGVGERLIPVDLSLDGYWLVVVKPDVYISTREAFSGVTPAPASFDLRCLPEIPICEWRDMVFNDFEKSIFPLYPFMAEIKEELYIHGAQYASLTGSGSCLYGIFDSLHKAETACAEMQKIPTISAAWLLKL